MRKYLIAGLADVCPLCLGGESTGRKGPLHPIFQVTSEGGYCGSCCAPHLAALIKSAEGEKPEAPKAATTIEPKAAALHAIPLVNAVNK